jgi:outer membrane protein TolC
MTTFGIVVAIALTQAAPAGGAAAAPAGARTLTLEDALREVQAKNFDLRAARARLDQSRELSNKAWSSQLPQVTASGSYTHNELADTTIQLPTGFAVRDCAGGGCPAAAPLPAGFPGAPTTLAVIPTGTQDAVIQKQEQVAAQIQATQAIFAPQAWYGIGAARAGERAAAENVEQVRRDVLFGAAQAYYGAANAKQVVKIQQRQLAIALDREKDARLRYEAGTTPKVSLLRAEIDRARAEQDLKRAQNNDVSARVGLASLLDRKDADFEVEVPTSPNVPGDDKGLEEAALRERPDVRAAAEQVTVADRTRQSVLARYLPVLGAFGRYTYSNAAGFSNKTTTWAIGLQASWDLFDGLLREADLRDNEARVREAEASRASAEIRAVTEVRQARLDLDSAVANREKAKEQAELARENQRLVNVNFRAGAATYLEVSDANAALLSAELSLVSEALNADLAALRLLKAAGAFDLK